MLSREHAKVLSAYRQILRRSNIPYSIRCFCSLVLAAYFLLVSANFAYAFNDIKQRSVNPPENSLILDVSTVEQLKSAVSRANQSTQGAVIRLHDGIYQVKGRSIAIRADHIRIQSFSGEREKVVIRGEGMTGSLGNLFDVASDHFAIVGVTLEQSAWHLIQLRAEADADYFLMDNCILQDAGQQLLKVSHKKGGPFSNEGIVRNSLFQYTAGVGPNYYIGGIDAHQSVGWQVENNTFKDISSPSKHIAEHAIHFWNRSTDNTIINNTIINSDRGIGFGLNNQAGQSRGGLIANNVIVHTKPENPFADVGIALESSPDTIVMNNTIFMTSNYPNAIEYRFNSTSNVLIQGNVTNKAIRKRDGASADVKNNISASISKEILDTLQYVVSK